MEDLSAGKISKAKCQEYFKKILEDALPKGQDEISIAGINFFQFLLKNYTNLDEEMKEQTNKMIDGSMDKFDSILKNVTETPEILFQKRLLRTLKKKLPSLNGLVLSLESRIEIDSFTIETKKLFVNYGQIWLDTLFDLVEESHQGAASFAKLSLLFSCVDELVCAFHLAQHGYSNQAYAHLRTILESINRVELFIKDESYADLWCSSDEKRKMNELTPAKVRKKLGIKIDPVYSFFCAYGSHPTFEYVKVKSQKKLSEKGKPEIKICLGGTQLLGHIYHSNVTCILVLIQLLTLTGKAFKDRVHLDDYPIKVRDFHKNFREYIKSFSKEIKNMGIDTTVLDLFLNNANYWEI